MLLQHHFTHVRYFAEAILIFVSGGGTRRNLWKRNLYQAELDNYISAEELHALAESPDDLNDNRPEMALNSNIELGCRVLDNPAIAAMASPINFVTKDFPPTPRIARSKDFMNGLIHYLACCAK